MKRTIKSIRVQNTQDIYKHTSKTVVFVNFIGGGFFGTRTVNRAADGTQTKSLENMTTEELAEAKKLAFKDGAWHDWTCAKEIEQQKKSWSAYVQANRSRAGNEDELNSDFRQPTTFASKTDANS